MMYFHSGQRHAKDRTLRPSTRQVARAASAGHHMIATTIVPKAIPRWPDQTTGAQITELNSSVNSKKTTVARFGVSSILCNVFDDTDIPRSAANYCNQAISGHRQSAARSQEVASRSIALSPAPPRRHPAKEPLQSGRLS